MKKIVLISVLLWAFSGCGGQKESAAGHRPDVVSSEEAWKIAKAVVERVQKTLEKGDLEGFHRMLTLKNRMECPLEKLRETYEKGKEELLQRVRTTQLLHVFPPSPSDRNIVLSISHFDGSREFWRLVYEEKEWRITQMALKLVDLGYNR